MKLISAKTPQGFVVRRIFASGEDAYRKNFDGSWDHCSGHKGPWVGTNAIYVPREVLAEMSNLLDAHAMRQALLGNG